MNTVMKKTAQSGFTLIELMIAVAIMGILTSIAISSYSESVIKSKRTDAKDALTTMSVSLEKCKAMYGLYDNNCSIKTNVSKTSAEGLYTITPTITSNTFTLKAVPVAGKSQAQDTSCNPMTLTHLGVQQPIDCW